MLSFTHDLPKETQGFNLPLLRCPGKGKIVAIVTSNEVYATPTHFWGGRTVPCEGQTCAACHESVPWRLHSYLSAFIASKGLHFLYESTAKATEPFILYRKANQTLRGCLFQGQRATSRPNSHVVNLTKTADLSSLQLPEEPSIPSVLATIWNIKLNDVTSPDMLRDCHSVKVERAPQSSNGHARDMPPVGTLAEQLAKAHAH